MILHNKKGRFAANIYHFISVKFYFEVHVRSHIQHVPKMLVICRRLFLKAIRVRLLIYRLSQEHTQSILRSEEPRSARESLLHCCTNFLGLS
jgi:hypothetical protein